MKKQAKRGIKLRYIQNSFEIDEFELNILKNISKKFINNAYNKSNFDFKFDSHNLSKFDEELINNFILKMKNLI